MKEATIEEDKGSYRCKGNRKGGKILLGRMNKRQTYKEKKEKGEAQKGKKVEVYKS